MASRFRADRCPTLADLVRVSDGELTAVEWVAFLKHRRRCPACRDMVLQIQAFTEGCAEVLAEDQHATDRDARRTRGQREARSDSFDVRPKHDARHSHDRRGSDGTHDARNMREARHSPRAGNAPVNGHALNGHALHAPHNGHDLDNAVASRRARERRDTRDPYDALAFDPVEAADTLEDDLDAMPGAEGRYTRFLQRFHEYKQARIHKVTLPPMRKWLPIAAAIPVLVCGLLLSQPEVAVLRAEELLVRAATYEHARRAEFVQRVKVELTSASAQGLGAAPGFARTSNAATPSIRSRRVSPFVAVFDVVDGLVIEDASTLGVGSAIPAVIVQILADHHFNARRMLDIDGFMAWRNSLTHKRDRVAVLNDSRLALHTTTSEGLLRAATLFVQRDTFHVVRVVLLFEGIGRLDIEEMSQWPRTPLPSIAFSTSVTVAAPAARMPTPTATSPSTATAALRLARWLDRSFKASTRDQRAVFVPELERLTSSVRSRIHALHALALQHPEVDASSSSAAPADAALQRVLDDHYGALQADLARLDARVWVLLGKSPDDARLRPSPVRAPPHWQRGVLAGVSHANTFAQQVTRLLTHDDLPADPRDAASPQSIDRTFDALIKALNTSTPDPARPQR